MIDELDRELRLRGVPARRRRRIRLELEDHLACDPGANLGDPVKLGCEFADQLGTARVRRAAIASFVALVPLGLLLVVLLGAVAWWSPQTRLFLSVPLVLGMQLAFVGGVLAVLRAWRLRRTSVIPRAEAQVLLRRAALGVAGGAVTVLSLFLHGGYWLSWPVGGGWQLPDWVLFLGLATVVLGSLCVVAATVVLVRAIQLVPIGDGPSRDLSFDLGIDADPWQLALAIAGAVALCIAVAGVVQSDPLDGVVRAIADGSLSLAGFALLGRPLGLRRQPA